MRPESTRSPRATPSKRVLPSPLPDDRRHIADNFYKFVDVSTSILSHALSIDVTMEDLLDHVLLLAHQAAGSEIEVVCLRERDEVRCRVRGLEGRGPDVLAVNPDVSDLAAKPGLHALSMEDAVRALGAGIARHKAVKRWHCLPMLDGEGVLGAVYLGMAHANDFCDDDRLLVEAFGSRTVIAFLFHLQRTAMEGAIRARDQVLSVVAHDLKNPLHVIAIAASALIQRFPDSSARRALDRIIRSAQRADQIIRDLLEIDAIETGRLSLDRRTIEPADVILASLDSQQSLAAEASVIIGADLSPELPAIDADEERIHRVLENLIGNAIKFTGAGGQIAVGASSRDRELLVWVKDSGIGISPEHMPHIFNRFYQASKSERHGTGLGLTICKGIIEAHNGHIWAESTYGEGTTMYFTLPAASTTAAARGNSSLKRANILIVDDRPENIVALEAILSCPEYRLVTATSGEEALSLALREQFAVALIDVAMPGMNGLDVAVNLKALERSRETPIIFITAFGNDPEEIHRAYTAGGADYLVKPLDPEIVRKKVAVFVELSRRRNGADRTRATI